MKLDELRKVVSETTPGEWTIGRLLETNITRKWSIEEKQEANKKERSRVFANFSHVDAGRGRDYIANFEGNFNEEADKMFVTTFNPVTVGKLLDVVEAAKRECYVNGDGYYRTHVSDDLHRALSALESEEVSGG